MNWEAINRYGPYLGGMQAGAIQQKQDSAIDMNPLKWATGMNLAGGVLGGLGSWLGGSQQRKDQAWGRNRMKSMFGQDIIDPQGLAAMKKNSFMANMNPLAESANARFGLDSGRAQQSMMAQFAGQEGDFLADAIMKNLFAKSQRDTNLAMAMHGGY